MGALQLNVTDVLLVVGPGLLTVPGLGFVGIAGIGTASGGVWKYSEVV